MDIKKITSAFAAISGLIQKEINYWENESWPHKLTAKIIEAIGELFNFEKQYPSDFDGFIELQRALVTQCLQILTADTHSPKDYERMCNGLKGIISDLLQALKAHGKPITVYKDISISVKDIENIIKLFQTRVDAFISENSVIVAHIQNIREQITVSLSKSLENDDVDFEDLIKILNLLLNQYVGPLIDALHSLLKRVPNTTNLFNWEYYRSTKFWAIDGAYKTDQGSGLVLTTVEKAEDLSKSYIENLVKSNKDIPINYFVVLGAKSYGKAKLCAATVQGARALFYLKRERNSRTIEIHYCEYVSQQVHADANRNKSNMVFRYNRISKGLIHRDHYSKADWTACSTRESVAS